MKIFILPIIFFFNLLFYFPIYAKILVTINQYASHNALDEATRGVKEGLLLRNLYPNQVEIKIANSQGNVANTIQIAKHQASLKPNFMLGIATPAAQSLIKSRLSNDITIGFAAVSDPIAAGLGEIENVIGVSDKPPIEDLIAIFKQIIPKLKTIGVIYNPGEINSVKILEVLEEIGIKNHLIIEKVALTSSNDSKIILQKLLTKNVETIYIPQDNMVVSAIDTIINESMKVKIPVISNDPSFVKNGLLLALGCDYFSSGKQLGFMIADKIENKPMSSSIQPSNIKELKINYESAKLLNLHIPENIRLQEK